jgi:hypothetical protein
MRVENVEYSILVADPSLRNAFVEQVQASVAEEVGNGATPADMEVKISPGSVQVEVRVHSYTNLFLESIHQTLNTSQNFSTRVAQSLQHVPGIGVALTGDIEVSNMLVIGQFQSNTTVPETSELPAVVSGTDEPTSNEPVVVLIIIALLIFCCGCLLIGARTYTGRLGRADESKVSSPQGVLNITLDEVDKAIAPGNKQGSNEANPATLLSSIEKSFKLANSIRSNVSKSSYSNFEDEDFVTNGVVYLNIDESPKSGMTIANESSSAKLGSPRPMIPSAEDSLEAPKSGKGDLHHQQVVDIEYNHIVKTGYMQWEI